MSKREQIRQAAGRAGWSTDATSGTIDDPVDSLVFRKGHRTVSVHFAGNGRIVAAFHGAKRMRGRNIVSDIIATLNKQ